MDSAERLPVDERPKLQPLLSADTVVTILWEGAWSAAFRAFIVQIFGSIAVGFLSEVFHEMSPSAPPGFAHHGQAVPSSHVWHGVRTLIAENQFWMVFAGIFVITIASRFAHYSRKPKHRRIAAWFLLINRRISCHWFHLFIINAFTAWIYAMIIVLVQQFSWTKILWSIISEVFHPVFLMVARLIPGAGILGRWFSWYGENQSKFLFWLLYSAAICDDLGLPNYKALSRWAWQRLKGHFRLRSARITETKSSGALKP
jgi:hypothetical protein